MTSAFVTIGRVVKTQGRHGELLVEPLSDRPERFPSLRSVLLARPGEPGRRVQVVSVWPHKGRFVLKLEGVDSIDDGERLRGQELVIPQDELPELPAGSYYHHELIGLPAEDEAGRPLGRVRALLDTGAVPDLVLEQEGQEERLVPLATEFFKRLDRARGVVVLAPPVWAAER